MKCLDCGTEMEQGTVEGYAQGGAHSYEFTADTEKKKTGIKGFFPEKLLLFCHIQKNNVHGIVRIVKKY